MTSHALLESIDFIEESCKDSEIDVFNAMSETYAKCVSMIQFTDDMSSSTELIQEATNSSPTTTNGGQQEKPGILKRLLKLFLDICRFIGKQLVRFVRFIGRLLRFKKKTADQIAEEVGVTPKKNPSEAASTPHTTSKTVKTAKKASKKVKYVASSSKRYTPTVNKNLGTIAKTVSIPLEIETDDGNVTAETIDFDLLMKNLQLKLNANGTFSLRMKYVWGNRNGKVTTDQDWTVINNNNNQIDQRDNKIKSQPQSPAWTLAMLSYPADFSAFFNMIQIFAEAIESNDSRLPEIAKKIVDMASKNFDYTVDPNVEFKYTAVIELQKQVSTLTDKLESLQNAAQNIRENDAVYKTVIDALNKAIVHMNNLQMSLTTVTSLFNTIYDIDASFEGTISDKKVLAKFVDLSIKSGMPPKNVIYNIYLISTPELRGEKISIKAGQSRAVIFPDNDERVVYKCATNGFGIQSNRVEKSVTDLSISKFKELQKYIALTTEMYQSGALVVQERVLPTDLSERKASYKAFAAQLKSWIIAHPDFTYNIGDIHYDNIGKSIRTNEWVAIDYGIANRR